MSKAEIYAESSKEARMADTRVRITVDNDATQPDESMDLMFSCTDGEIPTDAIFPAPLVICGKTWTLYTTDARAAEFLGDNYPSAKLREALECDKKIWRSWLAGCTYGVVIETWSPDEREFQLNDAFYGLYGEAVALEEAANALENATDLGLPQPDLICADDEIACEFGAAE